MPDASVIRSRRHQGTTRTLAATVLTAVVMFQPLNAAETPTDNSPAASSNDSQPNNDALLERNLTMKTLGGRQFWGDVLYFHDWRIQKSVLTQRYRLLDGNDYRHAAGTLEECRAKLDAIKKEKHLAPMSGKAVIALHGIIRSSKSFNKMRGRLQDAGYTVFGFDYPSTRVEISDSAEFLHNVIESLDGIEEIDFVVHSMGGLVVRSYLSKHRDPRIKRMVMLGVPNLGADMADRLRENPLYRAIFGPAGQQLVTDGAGFISKLPTPDFEFAVIAGARGTLDGYNPLIRGDDDGTVAVAGTRLPGAADFVTVRCLHSFLMFNDEAIDYTLRFLGEGHLRANGLPHPIAKHDENAVPENGDSSDAPSDGMGDSQPAGNDEPHDSPMPSVTR